MNLIRTTAFAATAFAAALSVAALAANAPPPVSSEPQNTSATYGDWTLRCSHTNDGKHICEVMQSFQIQVQGQQQPFAQLEIGHVNPKDPMHVAFVVNPNVGFPSEVKLLMDDKDAQPVTLTWSNCTPSACRADGEFKDDQLKRWKALTANGKLVYKASNGQLVSMNISVRGMPQALDALAKS
jgi:invasion protein IalB